MRDEMNVVVISQLAPDFMGFIFYQGSKRFVGIDYIIPRFDRNKVKCAGVFVNHPINEIISITHKNKLSIIQLHGSESVEYCEQLKRELPEIDIWKVFLLDDKFDFRITQAYERSCQAFLFDSKSEGLGGSGQTFDWAILNKYSGKLPFVIAGGVGLSEVSKVKDLKNLGLPILAVDINSKAETAPGMKSVEIVQKIIKEIRE